MFDIKEFKFKIKFMYHERRGVPKEERWGTGACMSTSWEDAEKEIVDGYKTLGQKVLKVVRIES